MSGVPESSGEGVVSARPRVIVVVAPKGGVGKTTIAMNLLVSARQAGLQSVGVDMDGQRSLEGWANARQTQRSRVGLDVFPEVPVTFLASRDWRRLGSMAGAQIAVVDTAPGHLDEVTAVEGLVGLADIVLIPTGTMPQDLFQVIPFHSRIRTKKAFFVLNRVKPRTLSFSRARLRLAKSGRLCPVEIPDREAIGVEYENGLVLADRGLPGTDYFDALWNFVAAELELPLVNRGAGEGGHAA